MSARDDAAVSQTTGHTEADAALERQVGTLLRVGVLLAAAVTLAGGVLLLAASGGAPTDLASLPRATPPPSSIGAVLRGTLALDPRAVTQLGVVLLIATPVARVALTLVTFLRRRDRLYVAMTALVLALLLWGILFGV